MANDSVFYSIGEMARLSGLPAKTLRYYDDIGLLSPARRQGSGDYRFYTREQLEQVLLLQSLKSLGMSLRQIRQEFDQMSSVRYEELLKKQGTWECALNPLPQEFGTLYDLGDVITVLLPDYDMKIQSRLVRFTQKAQNNVIETTLEVGKITIMR